MIFNKNKSKSSSSKPRKDFIAKILSVVAALALWFYVVDVQNVVEERTIYNVPVEVEQLDASTGMTVVSGMDYSIDVVVRGSKNDIKNLTNQNISARVDKSDYNSIGDNWCDIRIKTPDNVSVVSRSVQNINVSVDNIHEKTFEIDAVAVQYKLAPNLLIDEVIPKTAEVTVSGPESLIDTVKGAQIKIVRNDLIDNNISDSSEKILLIDENGNIINNSYLTVTPEYVGYEIRVLESKTLKDIEVSLLNSDVISDKFVVEFEDKDSIDFLKVLCKKDLVGIFSESDVSAFVDVSKIDSEGKHTLDVEFELPDGVTIADGSQFSFDVVSYEIDSEIFLLDVLCSDGSSHDFKYSLSDDFVSVAGPQSSLNSISSAVVYVDSSEIVKGHKVVCDVKLLDADGKEIEDSKLVIKNSSVTVSINSVDNTDFSFDDIENAAIYIKDLADMSIDYFSDDVSNIEYDLLVVG